VERFVLDLAQYGAAGETGVWRPVYSEAWVAAQRQVGAWLEAAGLVVSMDAVGNVWGKLEGSEPGPSIVTGSHIDSQTPGGRYDGALGVIAGILAVTRLKELYGVPRRTIEVVSLCEEEGTWFPGTNFWGSRAITGDIKPQEPGTILAHDGTSIGEAMRAVGLDPYRIPEAARSDISAYIELHIEQGPILEQESLAVGIVQGLPGLRHYLVEITGRTDHAGGVPMDLRRDAMAAAAEIIATATATARIWGRPAVTTTGHLQVEPNLAAAIPGKVIFTLDARHPVPTRTAELYATHEAMMREVAARHQVEIDWRLLIEQAPCPSSLDLVRVLELAASEQGIPAKLMYSGGGHDAQRMAQIAEVAMIFVQSKDGRSHSPAEYTAPEHAAAGIQVLAAGLHQLAY